MNAVDNEIDSDRLQQVLIFFLGTCDELVLKGLVGRTPNSERLTADGYKIYQCLKNGGFKAAPEELAIAVEAFRRLEMEPDEDVADVAPQS